MQIMAMPEGSVMPRGEEMSKETITTADYSWAKCTNWPDHGPMSDTILPIKLRENVTVLVQGIPHDLTQVEAEKIARVIEAHHV